MKNLLFTVLIFTGIVVWFIPSFSYATDENTNDIAIDENIASIFANAINNAECTPDCNFQANTSGTPDTTQATLAGAGNIVKVVLAFFSGTNVIIGTVNNFWDLWEHVEKYFEPYKPNISNQTNEPFVEALFSPSCNIISIEKEETEQQAIKMELECTTKSIGDLGAVQ